MIEEIVVLTQARVVLPMTMYRCLQSHVLSPVAARGCMVRAHRVCSCVQPGNRSDLNSIHGQLFTNRHFRKQYECSDTVCKPMSVTVRARPACARARDAHSHDCQAPRAPCNVQRAVTLTLASSRDIKTLAAAAGSGCHMKVVMVEVVIAELGPNQFPTSQDRLTTSVQRPPCLQTKRAMTTCVWYRGKALGRDPTPGLRYKIPVFSDPAPGKS